MAMCGLVIKVLHSNYPRATTFTKRQIVENNTLQKELI